MAYSEYEAFDLTTSGQRLDDLKRGQRQSREALAAAPDHPELLHEAAEICRQINDILGD